MNGFQRKSPIKTANELSILLRTVLGEDRFPVNVEALALERSRNNSDPITSIKGLEIDGFEGMLRAHRKKPGWKILYNKQTRYPGRERFTLAHEFGHYLLHREPLTEDAYKAGKLSSSYDFECHPLQLNQWKKHEKEREEEADTFASYLLMPIDDYRSQATKQEVTREFLKHVTDRYGVSLLAAVRKWIEFTADRAAMVVARDGFALWGRTSDSALKTGIFIPPGMEIPKESIAARGPDAQGEERNEAIALPKNIWTFSRGSEPVQELAFFSERLGMSISVLLFGDELSWRERMNQD